MALLDRFKRKTKKEEKLEKIKEEKVEKEIKKEIKEEKPKKEISRKITAQVYQIVKEPHITERATFLSEQNKYVFKVALKANKPEIKKAIESLYGVKVEKVQIIHIAPKKRRLGRSQGWKKGLKKGFKKAIVTLAKGEKIELVPR